MACETNSIASNQVEKILGFLQGMLHEKRDELFVLGYIIRRLDLWNRGPRGSGISFHRCHLFWREPDMAQTRIPISRAEERAKLLREQLELSTAEIGLTVRTTNCLEERGIFTVRDLLNSTPKDLLGISNFGEKTLEEVYIALEKMGYYRPNREPADAIC